MSASELIESSPGHSTDNKSLGSVQCDATDTHSSQGIHANVKRRWISYIWDTLDKSPEERRFLFKLDAVLLTFASLGYFIKYLDQVNINNAFVSGMKEDLNLFGNQLNYMQTCWTVGYVIGQIPRYSVQSPLLKTSGTFLKLTSSIAMCF
jgi:ACS family pantothenate transporter-like MFS transporter